MSLPPLPLIDGCLFVDNSSWIESLSTCPRYNQYRCLNLRVSSGEKPSLNFGSALHLALEYRYSTYGNRPVDDKYYDNVSQLLTDFFQEHEPPLDDWRTSNWAMETIRHYNDVYSQEDFNLLERDGKFFVELPFAVELYRHTSHRVDMPSEIPIIYTGRIDLPISVAGDIWVLDWKTTSQLGDQFWNEYRMSAQPHGYAWAWWQTTGKAPKGYIISAIRSKQPPQYVLSGQPWRGKAAMTPAQWWRESLVRERFMLREGELSEWRANTIDIIEEFFYHYDKGYMPMKTKWCAIYGKCPYFDVCTMAPEDRELMLHSGAYVNNTWSPLLQPTQPKQ